MKSVVAALTLVLVGCGSVRAQDTQKTIGEWEVSIKTDSFDDSKRVVAFTLQHGHGLGVRCFSKELSIVLGDPQGRFQEGTDFDVKFRADHNEVIETTGSGLSDKLFQLDDPSFEMVKQIAGAQKLAFRVSYLGTASDWAFTTKNAARALPYVLKECPPPSEH